MKQVPLRRWVITMAGLLAGAGMTAVRPASSDRPQAEEIVHRAIERAKWTKTQNFPEKYAYTRRSVREELDDKGSVKKREEKLYQVSPVEGVPYVRLVQKDGKPLSADEQKKQQRQEKKQHEKLVEQKRQKKDDKDAVTLNDELVHKYQWDLAGREAINGRPVFVLHFTPRSKELPVKRNIDRLLNKLAGKVWIDEQDYEIAKIDVHLTDKVTMWGGAVGTMRQFDLLLEQTKVDEVAWLPSRINAHLDGRVLLSSPRVKQMEQRDDFRRVAPGGGKPGTGTR